MTLRAVENYLEQNAEELARNGYEVVTGNRLKAFKLAILGQDDPETDFGIIVKTARLGVLDFRAFLNLSMLMTESKRAGLLRQAILDIVIDTINHLDCGRTAERGRGGWMADCDCHRLAGLEDWIPWRALAFGIMSPQTHPPSGFAGRH